MLLIIETCTERGLVAIAEKERILFEKMLPFGYNNSANLLPAIEEGLSALKISASELQAIVAGIGPGSYTGIRVGAAAAMSLAYATKLPLIGLPSLVSFLPDRDGPFAAIIDAKIGGAYLQLGHKQGSTIKYRSEPLISPLNELGNHLEGIPLLVTPQSNQLQAKLSQIYPNNGWKWIDTNPSANHLAAMAWEKLQAKDYTPEAKLNLLYLRKTQAEIEKGKE